MKRFPDLVGRNSSVRVFDANTVISTKSYGIYVLYSTVNQKTTTCLPLRVNTIFYLLVLKILKGVSRTPHIQQISEILRVCCAIRAQITTVRKKYQ